ncbi:uncharacterized protein LOC129961559 [Argiope bruennichi]|uniref:uncharacterized protein LOC129961559 n=1 Tax=Argiope bruennichi TaxID=94029 RepID=UPI00249500A6|nr:uncharacterized protein LOC129961559 [Argiope bruennichi]
MDRRFYQQTTALLVMAFLITIRSCDCAPAFKIKHYNMAKSHLMPNFRSERRFVGGSSPIHFISPYIAAAPQPEQSFDEFFFPQVPMGKTAPSSIYKLPLQLFNNGKPHRVMHVIPKKRPQFQDYFPHGDSKMIRLPLKFVSNGKPVGIYLKDQSMNLL